MFGTRGVVIKNTAAYTTVTREGDFIYKTSPKYLSDNEEYFLRHIHKHTNNGRNYVPQVIERVHIETIKMPYYERNAITNVNEFMSHLPIVLNVLAEAGIRHGDLTEYAIITHNNRPIVIDFAEARWAIDPIPSKRPEPDAVLLERAMRKLCTKL